MNSNTRLSNSPKFGISPNSSLVGNKGRSSLQITKSSNEVWTFRELFKSFYTHKNVKCWRLYYVPDNFFVKCARQRHNVPIKMCILLNHKTFPIICRAKDYWLLDALKAHSGRCTWLNVPKQSLIVNTSIFKRIGSVDKICLFRSNFNLEWNLQLCQHFIK